MKEYIERAAVKDEILSWAVCINHPELLSKEDTMYCIDNIPADDVAEVRHGRWFFTEYEFFTCSVCGESYYNGAESTAQAESYLNSGHTYKYCPNCGARMGKEET